MNRPDGRIEKGQRLTTAISARAWNRAQDAADIVLGATPGVTAGDPAMRHRPYLWVYGRNGSDVAFPRWSVVKIDGIVIAPDGSDTGPTASFQEMPVVQCVKPDASTHSFGITVEPISKEGIGKVAVAGVVPVKLNIVSARHWTAGPQDANFATLQTGRIGATILWKQPDSTGNSEWGLVRLGGEQILFGTFSGAWQKNTTKLVTILLPGGGPSPVGVEAINLLASIEGEKRCAIARFHDSYSLLAVEC